MRELEQERKKELVEKYEIKINGAEVKQEELNLKLREIDMENKRLKEIITLDTEGKIVTENIALERAENDHNKELERVKEHYNQILQEIKLIYEKQRQVSDEKLEKADKRIKELESYNVENIAMKNIQEKYSKEIKQLNKQLEEFKNCTNQELNKYRKQINIQDHKEGIEQSVQDENAELKKQINNLKTYIENMEGTISGSNSKGSHFDLTSNHKYIIGRNSQIQYSCIDFNEQLSKDPSEENSLDDKLSSKNYISIGYDNNEEKKELIQKLEMTERKLNEVANKYEELKSEIESNRREPKISLRNEISNLITKLDNAKNKLFSDNNNSTFEDIRSIFTKRVSESEEENENEKEKGKNFVLVNAAGSARGHIRGSAIFKELDIRNMNITMQPTYINP